MEIIDKIRTYFGSKGDKAVDTLELLKSRYAELCAYRDAVNAKIAPLQKQLDEVNAIAQRANASALEISKSIQEIRGGEAWIKLKREIGILARALSGR